MNTAKQFLTSVLFRLAALGLMSALLALAAGADEGGAHHPPSLSLIHEVAVTPDVVYGGQSFGIDIHPTQSTTLFTALVAMAGGGLYKTTDGAASWTRIEGFPMFSTVDVRYDPFDPKIVIATSRDDSRVNSQGGIWRSGDGGDTWTRANQSYPCLPLPAGLGDTPSAFDIDVVAEFAAIFVATDCGVRFSNDGGQTFDSFFPGAYVPGLTGGTRFRDVAVLPSTTSPGRVQVYACGQSGVYELTLGEDFVWTRSTDPSSPPTGLEKLCGVTISPFDSQVVFAVVNSQLYESDDGGLTWTAPVADPIPNFGGGKHFVAARPPLDGDAGHFELYWGDGFAILRQHCNNDGSNATPDCPVTPDPNCTDSIDNDSDQMINEGCPAVGGTPEPLEKCKGSGEDDGDGVVNDGCPVMEVLDVGTHRDPSDIAFDPTPPIPGRDCPLLVVNDGGVARSFSCGVGWDDRNVGIHALQIADVCGTMAGPGPQQTDLYIWAQHNGAWTSLDAGANWSQINANDGVECSVDRQVPPAGLADVRIVGADQFGYALAERGWVNPQPWTFTPGGGGAPVMFGNQRYAQFGLAPGGQNQLYITQPETGAQCDNNADDDKDKGFNNAGAGAVNDGCPAIGTPETGAQCFDAVDDDADGGDGAGPLGTNDGCSHIFSAELACTDDVDEDGDGVVNDGCPLVGSFSEAGTANTPTPMLCLDNTDAGDEDPDTPGIQNDDAVVNDGCPQVGVWGPMGPAFDGSVDGGLKASGPDTAPTFYVALLSDIPVAGISRETISQCLNNFNDDSTDDAVINDGCDIDVVGNPEFGSQCSNIINDDPIEDLRINDGCNWHSDLWKIVGAMDTTATMTPAMGLMEPDGTYSQLRSVHWFGQSDFIYDSVFAVDPKNPDRLYAVDINTQQVKHSVNGGASWSVDLVLTDLVTHSGEFRFTHNLQQNLVGQVFTIAFDPQDGQRILVGTEHAGIIASEGGGPWTVVPGSFNIAPAPPPTPGFNNGVPAITAFFFDDVHDTVWVSSYGRGLWKMARNLGLPPALVVDSPGDDPDLIPGDGLCATAIGDCTLRATIQEANAKFGKEEIVFNLPGPAPYVIQPATPLPPITEAVVIDGSTQPGFVGTPVIELNGRDLPPGAAGLVVGEGGGGSVVERLKILFASHGIELHVDTNTVRGNIFGEVSITNPDFNVGDHAVLVNGNNNVIGGTGPGERNIIGPYYKTGVFIESGTGTEIHIITTLQVPMVYARQGPDIDLAPAGVTFNDPGDADPGANGGQNFPDLLSAMIDASNITINGKLNSAANTLFGLELFAMPDHPCNSTGYGGGTTVLGSETVQTDGDGNVNFVFERPNLGQFKAGDFITATATDPNGNTSEYSGCLILACASGFNPNPGDDTDGDGIGDYCDPDDDDDSLIGSGATTRVASASAGPCPGGAVPFGDCVELFIGTDPRDACADTDTANDESPDPYPLDFNDDGSITGFDLSQIAAVIGQAVPPAPARRDLTVDGAVTGAELSLVAGRIGTTCIPPGPLG